MNNNLKFAVIIPARYASTRFPGKPLALLGGKPMIIHVCERVSKICPDVIVATDDNRIFECVINNGYRAVMTSENHKSGTDRVAEASLTAASDADVIINVQGDEPFIETEQLRLLMECFNNPKTDIATLARKFNPALGFEALFDSNLVKVTFDNIGNALYFSRSIIPYVRSLKHTEWLKNATFYTHVGIYAYRSEVLQKITKLPQSSLEKAESLEQLRWLQNGLDIKVAITDSLTIGIDTPEDLKQAEKYLQNL